jgi:O-antigen/teichoic acid export membrane protein
MNSAPTTPSVPSEPALVDDRSAVSLRRVAGRGALASAGVEIGGRALSLLLSLAVARTLGPKETGLLGLAVLFSALVSFVGALPETAAVAAPRERTDSSWALAACLLRIFTLLAMGVVAALVLFVVYPHSRYAGAEAAPRLLRISGVLLLIPLLECVNTFPLVMLQRRLRLAALIWAQALQYAVSCTAGLMALALGLGIEGVAKAAVVGAACACALLWEQAYGNTGSVRLFDGAQLRKLTRSAWRVTLGSAGGYVALRIDNVLVATSLGVTGMGMYAMAWNASRLPLLMLSRPAGVALLPALASIQHDPVRLTRGIRESLMLTFMAVGGCSAVLAVSAPGLVRLVLGPKWLPIVPCLRLMALTVLVAAIVPIGAALLTACGRPQVLLWPALLAIGCFVLLMPPVVARHGLLGAAFVDLLAASAVTLATYLLARRTLPEVSWWSGRQAVPVAAAVAGAAVSWLAGHAIGSPAWRLIAELCVFAGGYAGFLRLFGGLDALASLLDLARRILAPTRRDPA